MRLLALAMFVPVLASADRARDLVADGQHAAAAAVFEEAWRATRTIDDGLNAVITWRMAGHYAHARALLATLPKSSDRRIELRMTVLEQRLAHLTGTLEVEGEYATITVDGRQVERLGPHVVVDVGRRNVVLERPTCKPFRQQILVKPQEHVRVKPSFECDAPPGRLHVTLENVQDAKASVDGTGHDITGSAIDLELQPGLHHVTIVRNRIKLLDEEVLIPVGRSIERRAFAPGRARTNSLFLETRLIGALTRNGDPSGVAAVSFGFEWSWCFLRGHTGVGAHANTGVDTQATYAGATFAARWKPIWSWRGSRWIATLDVTPIAIDAGLTGSKSDESASVSYWSVGLVQLLVGWRRGHVGCDLWPVGGRWTTRFFGDDTPSTFTVRSSCYVGLVAF